MREWSAAFLSRSFRIDETCNPHPSPPQRRIILKESRYPRAYARGTKNSKLNCTGTLPLSTFSWNSTYRLVTSSSIPTVEEKKPGDQNSFLQYVFFTHSKRLLTSAGVRFDLPYDVGHRIPRRYDDDEMYMVALNAESLYLHIREVFLNLMNPLGNELLQRSFHDSLPIFRYPHYVKLMMICPMGAESYLHTTILPQRPIQKKCARFHPRANARAPQRQLTLFNEYFVLIRDRTDHLTLNRGKAFHSPYLPLAVSVGKMAEQVRGYIDVMTSRDATDLYESPSQDELRSGMVRPGGELVEQNFLKEEF